MARIFYSSWIHYIYNCSTVGFSIRNFKDLASVLGLLSFTFIVRDLEVFRLTLLNKLVTVKLTEREESRESNLIESRTEEGNFPTKISLICAWVC